MKAGNSELEVGTRVRILSSDDKDSIGVTGEITHPFPGNMTHGVEYIAGLRNIEPKGIFSNNQCNLTIDDQIEAVKDLKPYIVHVTESYSRNVVMWAEDADHAAELVEEFCSEDIISIDYDNFADRNVESLREAKPVDLDLYQSFIPSQRFESVKDPLDVRIQRANKQIENQSVKETKEKEITL